MSLISLVILLAVVGVGLYFIPMDAGIKRIIVIIVAVVVGLLLLSLLVPGIGDIRVGR